MKIVLEGKLYSTNNIYYHAGSRAFIKAKPKAVKDDWTLQARQQWTKRPLQGDIHIEITLFFGDKRTRDWDNYHKLSMDALSGIVWDDDCQIQSAKIVKSYDKARPRVEIDIFQET